jgi:hypothetical protein
VLVPQWIVRRCRVRSQVSRERAAAESAESPQLPAPLLLFRNKPA